MPDDTRNPDTQLLDDLEATPGVFDIHFQIPMAPGDGPSMNFKAAPNLTLRQLLRQLRDFARIARGG